MHFVSTLLSVATALAAVSAQADGVKNETQEYYLKTKVVPGQHGKAQFDALYLQAYHTGAGFNDATFGGRKNAATGFLNGTKGHAGDITYLNQVFDLGSDFPYAMIPESFVVAYSSWQPVRINAGSGSGANNGFFFNGTGLQYTTASHKKPSAEANEFGGWLACHWWHHNTIQLFWKLSFYGPTEIPSSCANVDLIPDYI